MSRRRGKSVDIKISPASADARKRQSLPSASKTKCQLPEPSNEVAKHNSVRFHVPSRISNILQTRDYSAYTKGRKNPRDDYEESATMREWWRQYVKETPVPGHYEYRDFLKDGEMNPIQATYNFAGQGRKHEPGISRKGTLLLPGLYQHSDFIQELRRRTATYSFKSSGRARTPPGFQDKDLTVPPWRYNIEGQPVTQKGTSVHPSGNSAFRSQSSRFPLSHFRPREGPPPGAYDPYTGMTRYAISSSFRSGMPRFFTAHTKVPGPGTYEVAARQY